MNEKAALWEGLRHYFDAFIPMCSGRRTFRTNTGHEGLGPHDIRMGDHLCIFLGFPTPFIARDTLYGWELVGECYVRDIMHG